MVCDKITFKGYVILTVYHKGFVAELEERFICKKEKMGRFNLVFTETVVENAEIDNICGWSLKEEGLVAPDSNKNPYCDSACAYIVHYSYANKPSCIYSFENSMYSLNLSINDFLHICEFTKKYTGIDLQENPMYFGDVFVCECSDLDFKCTKSNSVIINNLPANSTVIIHFKNKGKIVSSKKQKSYSDTDELEICSNMPWDCHDIEVFAGDDLIYYRTDLAYMRNMSFQMNIRGQCEKIKLNKIGTEYIVERESQGQRYSIGERLDEYEELLQNSTWEITRKIKAEKPDDQVFFIKPGELDKATKLIFPAFDEIKDELWVFDSYFTDRNGITTIMDWIRIIAHCKARVKNIVFYCTAPNKALNAEKIKTEVQNDSVLKAFLRSQGNIGINFLQVKSPIHDRFIISKKDDKFSGLSVGTSLNSLERNHYCISKLSSSASKIIYTELVLWMKNGNILEVESV